MYSEKGIEPPNNSICQIFTPDYIAELMVSRVLYYLNDRKKEEAPQKFTSIKFLEPCVGRGVFLEKLMEKGFPSSNITAYELDSSLAPLLIQKFPKVTFKFKNFLGAELSEKFDVIIGNPPYLGQNYNSELFQSYIQNFDICKKYFVGNMDLFYYFIHMGIEKLKPGGLLSYITTNYWITKSEKTGIKYLKPHVVNQCFLLEYIDLSKLQIFENATGQHNCIFILQKKNEKKLHANKNKSINIIQIEEKHDSYNTNLEYNQFITRKIINNDPSQYYKTYFSASKNNDLKHSRSWNLLYPKNIEKIVNKIETFCVKNGKVSYLKDYFIIRNGLIFITDEIFVLKEGKQIKIEDNDIFIKIDDKYVKLLLREKKRLKKLYKSSSIKKYGYDKEDFIGYALYFNKYEIRNKSAKELDSYFSENYPNLTRYLHQFQKVLREKLINAGENPSWIYFPRRGDRIKMVNNNEQDLMDLEPLYDESEKIFFPYISDTNSFGFTENSYFATSDTYFLWPRKPEKEINYLFLMAYLNSKLVYFLYKAKNIKIKRSKTKLENNLPIPNLQSFSSKNQTNIISSIEYLSSILINWNNCCEQENDNSNNKIVLNKIKPIENVSKNELSEKLFDLEIIIEQKDQIKVKKLIDSLIFKLFDLRSSTILVLLKKYYE
jgi:methylase of polypeptide subunit release factors